MPNFSKEESLAKSGGSCEFLCAYRYASLPGQLPSSYSRNGFHFEANNMKSYLRNETRNISVNALSLRNSKAWRNTPQN